MEKRRLLHTDLRAACLTLGTAMFGSTINESDSFHMLDCYFDAGGNFLDTSLNYADWQWPVSGISEKTIGKWLKQRGNRHDLLIGTKGACPKLNNGPFLRLNDADIVSDLQQSLRNLQTDTIDLYYLHRDDPSKPVAEIIDLLEDQVSAGNIRHYACSNWMLKRLDEAQNYSQKNGRQGFAVNQMMWSLAEPNRHCLSDPTMVSMDRNMKRYHWQIGMTAVPYSSQANGFFSGKYGRDDDQSDTWVGRCYYNEINFARLERVRHVARELGVSSSSVALAYMLSTAHGFDVFPIIGPKNISQLKESLGAAEIPLDANMIDWLEAGSFRL